MDITTYDGERLLLLDDAKVVLRSGGQDDAEVVREALRMN